MILGAATPMRKDAARVAISPAPSQPRRSPPIRQCSPRSAVIQAWSVSHALPLSPRAVTPDVQLFAAQPVVGLRRLAHMKMSISRNDAASFSCISPARRASSRIRTGAASTAAAPFGLLLCLLAHSLMSASCIRLGLTLHLAGVLLLRSLHRTTLPPSCISQCQITKPHRAGGCARNSDESLQPTHRRGRGSHVEAQ
jgi:hypothetical protein